MKATLNTFLTTSLLALLLIMVSVAAMAQSPSGINYQAIVRDAGGNILQLQPVSVKIEIIASSANGTVLYEETHDDTTNQFGLINLVIGNGNVQLGSMHSINWGADQHYIAVYLDVNGGTSFEYFGTSELQSVPYAMHANTVANDSVKDDDSDPTNEIQSLSIDGDTLSLSSGGSVVLPAPPVNHDNDSTNELQTLTLNGDSLWLSGGGVIDLGIFNDTSELAALSAIVAAHLAADQDTNATNEIQQLTVGNDSLWLSNGGVVDLNPYLNALQFQAIEGQRIADSTYFQSEINGIGQQLQDQSDKQVADSTLLAGRIDDHLATDMDTSASNEIQSLWFAMDSIGLSNGGGAYSLETYLNEAEFSAVNLKMAVDSTLFQSGINLNEASILSLEVKQQSDSATLAQRISTHELADADTNASNELQAISLSNDSLSLSQNGGSIDLSDYLDNTDDQTLSANASGTNRTLSISGGNNVTINVADNDNSASNELQQVSLSNDTLSLSQNGGSIDLSDYLDNTDDQTLSASTSGTNRTLSISGGNNVTINVADNDNNASNELQQVSLSNDTLSLSQNGGSIDLSDYLDNTDDQTLSASTSGTNRTLSISGGNNVSISVADNDNNASNELQQVSLSNDTLSLSQNGGTVSMAAYLDNTDEQTLQEVLQEDNDAAATNIENVGDLQLAPNKIIYLGDPSLNNTWRIRVDGIELKFEMRENGAWVEKVAFRQ